MGAKKAEPELGSFDCVYSESGSTPKVGKLHVFKTSLVFKAEMFGMDKTSVSIKRKDLDALDATSALTLKIQYKKTKTLDLQFTKSRKPYELIVAKYKLSSTEREGFSVNDRVKRNGDDGTERTYAPGVGGLMRRGKDFVTDYYENGNEKLKRLLKDASRLGGAKIPPTPRLPTVDCEEVVSRCLFVRVIGARDLLAMDSGGTSDPFVVLRYRGLEVSSRTIPLTLNPHWDETFTFNAPPGKEELDDSDEVELMVYDRDFGGLNDFIGYCAINMAGVKVSDGDAPQATAVTKTTTDKGSTKASTTDKASAKAFTKKSTKASTKAALREPLVAANRTSPSAGAGSARRRREWIKLVPMPKDHGDAKSFDLNHVKERLMFWEGERLISGAIEVETWVGNRHDEAFRVAGVPALIKPDADAEKSLAHYVDPVTALLRVEIKKGRNIMNLDDDGGSDPYCEVALVDPKGVKPESSQATHYIDDATDPEWDRAFNFIVSKPYGDDLELRVYDYDGATSFDDLIGKAVLKVSELKVHKGLKNAPEERWITLVDKEGEDANEKGEKYGDVLVRAYLDEEYFEHLHGGDANGRVGRLSVDVLGADGLEHPTTTHVVVKCGPYWTRTPNVEHSSKPRWNQRLRYPVFEPAERVTVALFEGAALNAKYLGRVKLQLSTMEDGVRYCSKFQLMTQDSNSGAVKKTCTLEVGLQFDYENGGAKAAAKYFDPLLPEKWYLQPLADDERERVIKSQKEMLVKRLAQANPPINEVCSKILLEFSKHEVNIGSIKSSVARIQRVTAGFDKIGAAIAYALSWDSVILTAMTQCWIVYLVYYPNMLMPTVLLATALWSLAQFPGRYQRVLDRAQADEWLSQGLPFAPPTEEEERVKREREEKEKAEEAAAVKAREEEEKELLKLSKEEREAKETQKKLLLEKKRAAEKAAAEKAKAEAPKETFSWESLNPLAALQKQMDEVFAMITLSQSILDEVAGGLERVAGVLSWEEPRVTAGFLLVILAAAWALVYVEVVTRFFVKIVLGVVVKTVFKIVSPSTLKFGASAGILFAMRHPAILPDEKTKVLQEAKARAAREAALAAELANEEGDDEEAENAAVAPPAAPPAPPSAPLAPLNVFFRMPTQSDRLL